jgi:DNA replication and repair protein RecF
MRVQSLQLTNFRNYPTLDVSFSPSKNIFLGNNGQGKTNLLEALYFLSHARSHRTASDRELVRTGEPFARVQVQLANHHYEGRTQLEAQIKQEEGRLRTVFKVNANTLRSRSELLGYLPTVSFFLPDLLLLRGSPENRRHWLDAAIVQYDKRHLTYLSEFQKVRQQKNRLLKGPPEHLSREHINAWNLQFAATGAKVTVSRLTYLAMIEHLSAIAYLELSDGSEQLGLTYQSTSLEWLQQEQSLRASTELAAEPAILFPISPVSGQINVPDVQSLELAMVRQLEDKMQDEIRRGTSLVGPHRDDIRFFLNGMEAEAYGSQGQQRSIVLALKLTELKCLNAKLQEPPVLLLDDVMAELDPDRQRLLVEHIHPDSQVFMTTTHPSSSWQALLEHRPEASRDADPIAVFRVSQGILESSLPSNLPKGVSAP